MRPTLCKWILAWPLTSVLETDNIKAMYDGIKQAFGPAQNKTALLKSAIGELIRNRVQQIANLVPRTLFPGFGGGKAPRRTRLQMARWLNISLIGTPERIWCPKRPCITPFSDYLFWRSWTVDLLKRSWKKLWVCLHLDSKSARLG